PGLPVTAAEIPPGLLPPGAPFENPFRGNKPELDPVPTGVAAGPDGTLYVANLSGFPYVAGKAKVLRVTPRGAVSDAATGLTMAGLPSTGAGGARRSPVVPLALAGAVIACGAGWIALRRRPRAREDAPRVR